MKTRGIAERDRIPPSQSLKKFTKKKKTRAVHFKTARVFYAIMIAKLLMEINNSTRFCDKFKFFNAFPKRNLF